MYRRQHESNSYLLIKLGALSSNVQWHSNPSVSSLRGNTCSGEHPCQGKQCQAMMVLPSQFIVAIFARVNGNNVESHVIFEFEPQASVWCYKFMRDDFQAACNIYISILGFTAGPTPSSKGAGLSMETRVQHTRAWDQLENSLPEVSSTRQSCTIGHQRYG